jgi:hypothetical protein
MRVSDQPSQPLQWLRKGFELNPERAGRNMDLLAMAYARSGQMGKPKVAAQLFIKIRPDIRLTNATGINNMTQPVFQR